MLATLEKIETSHAEPSNDDGARNKGAYEMHIPADAQGALDALLKYYSENSLIPTVKIEGSPLDITSTLVSEIKKTLPESMQIQGKILLNFIIQEIVKYCRHTSANHLSLNFNFEKM